MTSIQIAIAGKPLNQIEIAELSHRLESAAKKILGPERHISTTARRSWLQQLWQAHFVRSSWEPTLP